MSDTEMPDPIGVVPPGDDPALTELIRLQAKVDEQTRELAKLPTVAQAEELRHKVAELEATIERLTADIGEQKADLIQSAALLLKRLDLEPRLVEIRKDCFDDSHWGHMIDAALNKQAKP